jgi:uncharacterized protein YcbK (DUF882 family)
VFVNTGEHFNNLYYSDGGYIMPAVQQFSWTCRDWRAGEWKWIHPRLMDLVFVLHWKYNKDEIKILSGYRTPQTNAQLEGSALNSQHMRAMALDIHIPDVDNGSCARFQDLHLWRHRNVSRPRLHSFRFRPAAQLGRLILDLR